MSAASLVRHLLFASAMATLLASCAERQRAQMAPPAPDSVIEDIYVATERGLDQLNRAFGEPRKTELHFIRTSVAVPATHTPGAIEWPAVEERPNAATDFVIADKKVFADKSQFVRAFRASRSGTESTVFVHGYNNTVSEAIYRLAQIQTDFNSGEPTVLFSWPSAGDPRGYVYDRDSVLFARDDLESLLKELSRAPGDKVSIVAHSMGSHLVMEVLRQIALKGDRALLNDISSVVLMSPDIDPDLFRRQAEAIGPLPQPFLIFVSSKDRALNLSSILTGRKPRLGTITSPADLEGLDVSVIDFTQLSDRPATSHMVATSSPAAISVLKGMIAQAESGQQAFQDYMVLTEQP